MIWKMYSLIKKDQVLMIDAYNQVNGDIVWAVISLAIVPLANLIFYYDSCFLVYIFFY